MDIPVHRRRLGFEPPENKKPPENPGADIRCGADQRRALRALLYLLSRSRRATTASPVANWRKTPERSSALPQPEQKKLLRTTADGGTKDGWSQDGQVTDSSRRPPPDRACMG